MCGLPVPGDRGGRTELLASEPILQFVAPLGDPLKDVMFWPLTRQDFPKNGAVGYIKYAVLRQREARL